MNGFPSDALDANRDGNLSDKQRRNLAAWAADRRRSQLSNAAFFVAGALVVIFFASPRSSPVLRLLAICLLPAGKWDYHLRLSAKELAIWKSGLVCACFSARRGSSSSPKPAKGFMSGSSRS